MVIRIAGRIALNLESFRLLSRIILEILNSLPLVSCSVMIVVKISSRSYLLSIHHLQ